MRKVTTALVTASAVGALALTGCTDEATTVDENMTTAADNFEVNRRIVIINGITDAVLFEIEGRCSIKDEGNQLEVLCKISEGNDDDAYVKHMFGIPDNVTYMVVQLDELNVDPYHHRIVIRPETIVPDIDFQTSGG
jgi:hypothetical protein